MKLQKNRLIVSVVSAIVITTISYLTVFSILKAGRNSKFNKTSKSQKTFSIQLTYDIDRDKINTRGIRVGTFAEEIDALNKRGNGWLHQPVSITQDNKISVILDNVNETDTSMFISSFHSSTSVGFWETYPLNQEFAALGQLYKLANSARSQIIYPPETNTIDNYTVELGYVSRSDTDVVRRFLKDSSFTKLIPADAVFLFGNAFGAKAQKFVSIYAIRKPNRETNRALVNESHIQYAVVNSSASRLPEINLKLSHTGSRIFEELTKNNIGRAIAISVNDYIVSAPHVISRISGGELSISGNFLAGESTRLAFQFRCKTLPFPITLIHHETKKMKEPIYKQVMYFAWVPILIALCVLGYALYPFLGLKNQKS